MERDDFQLDFARFAARISLARMIVLVTGARLARRTVDDAWCLYYRQPASSAAAVRRDEALREEIRNLLGGDGCRIVI